jgi:hypothetical protein
MYGPRKSDSCIVPEKPPNKGGGAPSPAEGVEGRRLTEGNPGQQTRHRTQSRTSLQHALDRIRQAVGRADYPELHLRVITRGRSPVR